jgi:hypothetical protein
MKAGKDLMEMIVVIPSLNEWEHKETFSTPS